MTPNISHSSYPSRFRRVQFSLFLPALACLLLLSVAAQAQVIYNGSLKKENIGSQAVGSPSATVSLPFTIGSKTNTQVSKIAVLTTGIASLDFTKAAGSTCTAGAYTASTKCVVDVSLKPLAAGLRLGAVVFYSGTGANRTVLAAVPIYGVGTGPQVAFGLAGARSKIGSKLISPAGVAVDAAGDVFITDLDLQEVFKVTPVGVQTTVGSGLEVPQGVAVDGAGNVYIADSQAEVVYKVTPGGVQTTIGSGFSFPSGVAVDGLGNVYVTDPFTDLLSEITPSGTQTSVGSGFNSPGGVAVDAAGNIYVANTYGEQLLKIAPGGAESSVGTVDVPAAVAVDAAGDVYVTDDGTQMLYEVTPDGTQSTLLTDLNTPNGVVLDGVGNIYIADTYNSKVIKIDRADPPALSFDSTKVGSTSKDSPRTVDVDNIGNTALTFSALSYPTDFPQGQSGNNDCASGTPLASGSACALVIDFSPVTPLGSKQTSALLKEAVKLTTNNLNVPGTAYKVAVSGTEKR